MSQILAVLSTSLFSWLSSPSLPEACPQVQPAITAYALDSGVAIDHSKGREELAGLIGQKAFPGFYMQGLTDVTYATQPRFVIESHELADGRWCSSLRRATVEFGLGGPANVHIAREIPEGSCRYVTVLAHEMQHVGISQRAVAEASDDIRTQIEDASRRLSPSYGKSAEASSELLKASLMKVVNEVTQKHIARAEMENASIDTRRSYEILSAQCPASED